MTYTAAPGERNSLRVNDGGNDRPDMFAVLDYAPITSYPTDRCEELAEGYVRCLTAGTAMFRAVLADGDDGFGLDTYAPALAIDVDGGDGADHLVGAQTLGVAVPPATLRGGPGDDQLDGGAGNDTLDGGPGRDKVFGTKGADALDGGADNDEVDGGAGDDQVLGGDGDDLVTGDHYEGVGRDVVDGGAGFDRIEADWGDRSYNAVASPITLTLAGGADDGHDGEGDDVRGVEQVTTSVGGALTGTDAPEKLTTFQTNMPVTMRGLGGADELRTGDGPDSVDGGAGDDLIDAHFGDDTIVPGPGRDRVFADTQGGDCGPIWCKLPYGNDTVDAVDGEIDSITCGAGSDRVAADPADVVAPDCEQVERRGPAAGPAAGGTANGAAGAPAAGTRARLALAARTKLRTALRKGLRVRVTGVRAGTLVRATYRGRRVASGRVRAGAATLRFSTAARKRLGSKRTAVLVLRAGAISARVTLRR
jgi:Ca2+-binding RTX toxin-like protein